MTDSYEIRTVQAEDITALEGLLRKNDLPVCGLSECWQDFFVAMQEQRLIGSIGLVNSGKDGLLRSLAVAVDCRGEGVAGNLLEKALAKARAAGLQELYLLTGTAKEYFLRKGFTQLERTLLPDGILKAAGMENACFACRDCLKINLKDE